MRHTDSVINSVSEFIERLSPGDIAGFRSSIVSSRTFFRGQASIEWSLEPRLYREGLFDMEATMLEEIRHQRPNDFSDDRFADLALLQHFGMPTRLLDVTTNPLVALFFACDRSIEADGVVYMFSNMPTSWSSDPLVELIMDFCFEFHLPKVDLSEMLDIIMKRYENASHRLMPQNIEDLEHYLTIPAFCVMPQFDNARLLAQQGAFVVCGMQTTKVEPSINPGTRGAYYHRFSPCASLEDTLMRSGSRKFVVPLDKKASILDELIMLGVSEMTLFPDLTHAIKHVVEDVRSRDVSVVRISDYC